MAEIKLDACMNRASDAACSEVIVVLQVFAHRRIILAATQSVGHMYMFEITDLFGQRINSLHAPTKVNKRDLSASKL
jgi:hypothetical protein